MAYAVKIVFANGDEGWLYAGLTDRLALFPSLARARDKAEFIEMGLDAGDRALAVKAPQTGRARQENDRE